MAKRIKLTGEILCGFKRANAIHSEIVSLSSHKMDIEKTQWEGLRKLYPGLDMTTAYIDHEKIELVLPFEKK